MHMYSLEMMEIYDLFFLQSFTIELAIKDFLICNYWMDQLTAHKNTKYIVEMNSSIEPLHFVGMACGRRVSPRRVPIKLLLSLARDDLPFRFHLTLEATTRYNHDLGVSVQTCLLIF
jgi:hypothetical protein